MKDMARELGVSVPTVSRALKGSTEISEELKERVQQLARERDYRPNPFAQSLRRGEPQIIGVIVPNIVTHFHSGVIEGIEHEARRQGYAVVCANSHEEMADEVKLVDEMVSLHLGGIIACLSETTTDYSHFLKLNDMNMPVVFFARTCLPETFSSVVSDGVKAAYEGTTHLIRQGCQRIAFLGGPNHLDMVRRRKHGYLEALRDSGIEIRRELVRCQTMTLDASYQAMNELLDSDLRPDAVLTVNDTLIYGAMRAIREHGLRIPEDIRLMGFSDDEKVAWHSPSVSTIQDKAQLMGQQACKLLFRRMKGIREVTHSIIPMRLLLK